MSLKGTASTLGDKARRWYQVRNALLIVGMLLFTAARIWAGYNGGKVTSH